MQLIWLPSPTGRMHTLSITRRNILIAVAVVLSCAAFLGAVLHFFGLQVAVQVSPSVAKMFGGVTTVEAQQRSEATYRLQLLNLEKKLQQAESRVSQLEELKDRFARLATPQGIPVPARDNAQSPRQGKGGPQLPLFPASVVSFHARPVSIDLERATTNADLLETVGSKMIEQWLEQIAALERFPTRMPINGQFSLSSGFGVRHDPFTGHFARHDGLDFTAALGTPIVAAGDGRVLFAGHDVQYGWMVDIDHGNGLVSRYAHAQQLYVRESQRVRRGEVIAAVGSTGRSTGPHLHFEVIKGAVTENPVRYLLRAPS